MAFEFMSSSFDHVIANASKYYLIKEPIPYHPGEYYISLRRKSDKKQIAWTHNSDDDAKKYEIPAFRKKGIKFVPGKKATAIPRSQKFKKYLVIKNKNPKAKDPGHAAYFVFKVEYIQVFTNDKQRADVKKTVNKRIMKERLDGKKIKAVEKGHRIAVYSVVDTLRTPYKTGDGRVVDEISRYYDIYANDPAVM